MPITGRQSLFKQMLCDPQAASARQDFKEIFIRFIPLAISKEGNIGIYFLTLQMECQIEGECWNVVSNLALSSNCWNFHISNTLAYLSWIGNTTGNPGVTQANPYPYPSNPYPMSCK